MPSKSRKALITSNVTELIRSEVKAAKVKVDKFDKEDSENDEPGQTGKDWMDVLLRAITVKQNKTLIKTLASNSEKATEQCDAALLRRALWTSTFVSVPEGQKFCARSLSKIGVKPAFEVIKKAVQSESSTKVTWSHYGQLIAVAWIFFRKEDEDMCRLIEDEIMKGLFHAAIMLQSPLSDRFMEVLKAFKGSMGSHKAKMDDMLYQSSRVVLWRGCQANHDQLRFRACRVLLEFFPWRPSDGVDLEEATLKQYDLMEKMLMDTCYAIRSEAIYRILKICANFWIYIPAQSKRTFMTKICDELVLDSEVTVRCAIANGLGHMVMESSCLNTADAALKTVCPLLIADRNEKVRLATIDLLIKLIPNRYIKYWEITPMEKLMTLLAVETSESVKKKIVQLIFKTFYQENDDSNDMLRRLNYLAKHGRNAALTFYKLIVPERHISIAAAAEHLKNIAMVIYKVATGKAVCTDSKILDETTGSLSATIGDLLLNEQNPRWDRIKLFTECLVILYVTMLRDPRYADFDAVSKEKIGRLLTKVFQKMFICFKDTSALGTTLLLGSLLPQKMLAEENLITGILEHMREEPDTDIIKPYLEAVTKWNSDKVLDMIRAGLSVVSKGVHNVRSPISKRTKKAVSMTPAEHLSKALYYLAYIISSVGTNAVIVKDHLFEIDEFYKVLKFITKIILDRLAQGPIEELDDDLILQAYVMKQTLTTVLINAPRKSDRETETSLFYVKDLCDEVRWFEEQVVPYLEKYQDDANKLEFFFKMGVVFLRKLCDILMSYDFASVPTISKAPSYIQGCQNISDMVDSEPIVEINFIQSFKNICYSFLTEDTPSELMPSVFNAARQLLHLNSNETELAISTIMLVPTWFVGRIMNGDELQDHQIEAQMLQLLKLLAENPKFSIQTYIKQLCQSLIDLLQWCVQDASDCPDPREHTFQIPRFIDILLLQTIRKHKGLLKIFQSQLGARIQSHDLFESATLEFNRDRPVDLVHLEILGACTQLVLMTDLDPERISMRKQNREGSNEDVDYLLNSVNTRIDQLVRKSPDVDNFLLSQIQAMLPT